jgi:hypothetical protein
LVTSIGGGELCVPASQADAQLLQQEQRQHRGRQAKDNAYDQGDDVPAEQSLQ